MEWEKLLSRKRLGHLSQQSSDERPEFQRDYDRIVFSSAFRRLQDKAQVFPLAESDYVRTRLTHSIEASCVGRSLGTLVGKNLEKKKLISPDIATSQDIGNIVAAACLAHDIGNPPFGHSGEQAISNWFSGAGKRFLNDASAIQKAELRNFEGNAQGFRILTNLQYHRNRGGLQLTSATIGAFTKYPRKAISVGYDADRKVSEKKYGIFSADSKSFQIVAAELGLKQKSPDAWCRHPLAFLTEAADDICYHIIDFEDGFHRKRVSFDEAEGLLKKIAFFDNKKDFKSRYEKIQKNNEKIEYLRAVAINALVLSVVNAFDSVYDEILDGTFETDLISRTGFGPTMKEIKNLSKMQIYAAPTVVEIEAAGFEVLGGLLGRIVPALTSACDVRTAEEKKLRQLLPEQFLLGESQYEKLLNATDFVSGMTDSYAVTLYRRLRGIELPRG